MKDIKELFEIAKAKGKIKKVTSKTTINAEGGTDVVISVPKLSIKQKTKKQKKQQ